MVLFQTNLNNSFFVVSGNHITSFQLIAYL